MAGPGDVPGYERLGVISAAAGSTVLKARDLRTGRVCALKVMRTFEALDPERQARFEQEAQRLMALSHACVVRVWDVGVSGGTAWIAQELVEGPSLQELLDALGGPLPLEAALAVGVQLGSALVALSSADLAHLDISPANVLIAPDGVVELCDFGLGFELGLSQRLAGVQLTIQTVDCVAPELVEGELVPDLRADAYGLGATLYCCLTGRPPFAESELEVRLQSIVHEAPPDLLEIDPGIPPQLASAVGWLMARDRDDRPLPQDVGPWLEQLAADVLGLRGSPGQWAPPVLAGLVQRVLAQKADRTEAAPTLATLLRLRGAGRTVERVLAPGEQFDTGRSSDTDVPLPYSSISRRHARVLCTKDGLWLEDLGSANGSWVNGRRVTEMTLLQPGDQLRLGKLRFEVSLAEVLRPPPESACRLCGTPLEQPTSDPERAVCPRCRERAEADRLAGEERLRRTVESLGFLIDAPLQLSGAFHRYHARQGDQAFLLSLVELGQRAANAYAEGSHAAFGLEHHGLLPVQDLLVHNGTLVVVSHPHPGPTLASQVKKRGHLPPSLVANAGWVLADALVAAAQRGITQALVRPDLVLLGDDGHALLLDVGLAPALLEVHRLRHGRLAASEPCFEAPEVDDLRTLTPAALVYALGATLSYALTGNPPAEVRGGERFDNLPLTMIPSLPPQLAALLARSTAPNPRERPPSLEHLREALGALAQSDLDAAGSSSGSSEEPLVMDDERTDRSRGGSGSGSDLGPRPDSSHGGGAADRFRTQRIDRDRLT